MKTTTAVVCAAAVIILLGSTVTTMGQVLAENDRDDALHVFVITGQSNAAYYVSDVTEANEVTHISQDKAFFYGTSTKPMYYGLVPSSPTYDTTFASYGIHDMVDSSGDFIIGGLESAFASKYVSETGNKVLLINTAIGGQRIENMQPGADGNDYAQAVFNHAVALIPSTETVKYEGILFIQGEANADLSVSAYESLFVTMADSYMSFTSCPDIYISKVRAENAANPSTAQIDLCEEYSDYILASTAADSFTVDNGLMRSDDLHYTQLGKNIIGQQFASAYLDHTETVTDSMIMALIGITVVCSCFAVILYIIRNARD